MLFRWLKRKINIIRRNNEVKLDNEMPISSNLKANKEYLTMILDRSSDIIFRSLHIGTNQRIEALLVAVEGMHDKIRVEQNVINPLLNIDFEKGKNIEKIVIESISIDGIKEEISLNKAIDFLLKGDAVLFVNGFNKAFILGVRAFEVRGIQEPVSESVNRGPREGFIENFETNIVMLRRKIHHHKLKIEAMTIGKISKTDVAIAYIDGVANPLIVEEVRKRIKGIEIDAILDSGYIEELIEDAPISIFPTVGFTEKPSTAAGRILEGRVAIIVDGTPVVLTVPYLMLEAFTNPEDFSRRFTFTLFVRIIRLFSFLAATLVPGFYVAAESFHKELIPTELIINIAAEREAVPFPLFMEVFIFSVGFEILKEAGVRMPKHIGQAISIVGALILGEAAVNAGFAAAPTVIIVAVSSIAGLMLPDLDDTITVLRLLYIIIAAFLGVYGLLLMITVVLFHLASLRSFSIPYMSPWFPISFPGWKDFVYRMPLWMLNRRPEVLRSPNKTRQGYSQMPTKPNKPNRGE